MHTLMGDSRHTKSLQFFCSFSILCPLHLSVYRTNLDLQVYNKNNKTNTYKNSNLSHWIADTIKLMSIIHVMNNIAVADKSWHINHVLMALLNIAVGSRKYIYHWTICNERERVAIGAVINFYLYGLILNIFVDDKVEFHYPHNDNTIYRCKNKNWRVWIPLWGGLVQPPRVWERPTPLPFLVLIKHPLYIISIALKTNIFI